MPLGIKSKIEPELSKSSTNRMVRELEQEVSQVEQLQFESGGFQGRTMGGGMGGGPGGGIGGGIGGAGTAAGGIGLGAKRAGMSLGGLAKGAGVIGAVALAGTLASRMLGAMQQASGELQATSSIFGTALDLFFKPFGDFLGKWLRPLSKSLLEMAVGLNQNISSNGLVVGGIQSLLDLWNNLPGEVGKVIIRSWGQQLEGLFGENRFFTAMQDFKWSDWIPIVKWDDVLGGAFDIIKNAWPGWPSIKMQWPGWPTDALNSFEWPDIGQPDWPKITVPNELKALLNVEQPDDTDDTTQQTTTRSPRNDGRSNTSGIVDPGRGGNGGNGGGFWRDAFDIAVSNTLQVNGRRLNEETNREQVNTFQLINNL